jgi:hypothetical protein
MGRLLPDYTDYLREERDLSKLPIAGLRVMSPQRSL